MSAAAPRVAVIVYGIVAVPCDWSRVTAPAVLSTSQAYVRVNDPAADFGDHEVLAGHERDGHGLQDGGAGQQEGEVLVAAVVRLGQDPVRQRGLHRDAVGVGADVGQGDLLDAVAASGHVDLGRAVRELRGAGGDRRWAVVFGLPLTSSVRELPEQVAPLPPGASATTWRCRRPPRWPGRRRAARRPWRRPSRDRSCRCRCRWPRWSG